MRSSPNTAVAIHAPAEAEEFLISRIISGNVLQRYFVASEHKATEGGEQPLAGLKKICPCQLYH